MNHTFAKMYINCTDKEQLILKKIASAAGELNMPCFLIGGFVRDKILERPTKDIDIVCVGDGIELAELVAKKFSPAPQISVFKHRICWRKKGKLQPP
jgi:poly(A) polymerase